MSAQRASAQRIRVSYDTKGDVMYLSLGPPVPASSESRSRGILLRYNDVSDAPCGVTVLSFSHNGWDEHIEELAKVVADHLSIERSEVFEALHNSEVGALHG